MSKAYDDSLKTFISENPQDFASWLFPGADVTGKLLTEFKIRTIEADALLNVVLNDEHFLLVIEFQSTNDPTMAERLLEYCFEARREHKLPVYACVIYLRNDGNVPQSPLRWTLPNGQEVLQFHYQIVELGNLPTEELKQKGLAGLLPLLILTKDGATHEVVEEVITGLNAAEKYNLLPITKLLASLVFKSEADQNWLKWRFAMLNEILRNTPAYQEILEEGRVEGLEEGLEKGLEKGRQEALQQELRRQREALLDVVRERFPKIVRQAKKLAEAIDDTAILLHLIIKMTKAQTAEEARQLLFDAIEDEEQKQ